jgi:hypothetical protein
VTIDLELTSAIDAIRLTAKRMRADSSFKCIFEEWPPVTEADIAEWEEWADAQPGMAGYHLPSSLREIYSVTGGFRWRWQFLPDLPSVTTGSAEIVDLLSLFQRDDESDEPVAEIYRAPRPFDVISNTERVGIRFALDSNESLALIHVDEEESIEAELSLGIEKYLPTLARYRAAYGWQSIFHRKGRVGDDAKARIEAIILRILP